MTSYSIITYAKAKKFLDNLDPVRKARVDRFYDLFETYGPALPNKYLKKLSNLVWELRPGDIRLFLTITETQGHVIHAIHKKTQKTPKNDLNLATKRIKQIIN